MSGTETPLPRIDVESPCTQSWDAMTGDDKRRFCGECRLHVHNLSAMTSDEARELVEGADGRLCVRFFRRPDGTVLTQDCVPVRKRLQRRLRRLRVAAAALMGFLYPLGLAGCGAPGPENSTQPVLPDPGASPGPEGVEIEPTIGEAIMGDIAFPEEELQPGPEHEGCDAEPEEDTSSGNLTPEQLEKIEEALEDLPPREIVGRMIVR